MMLLIGYPSKKELKSQIGQELSYQETSMFGEEYTPNGEFTAAHRPSITGKIGREFFASIEMKNGVIYKVS
tara:strand:- start:2369 stop:2581 length:213 start_codon:yes stop_codon:yes gene_type:complete